MNVPKRLVRQMVVHFAELAGWRGTTYRVTLNRAEYERVQARRKAETPARDHDFGITLFNAPVLTWINAERHKSWKQLVNTCAHEGLHAARPELRHGAEFEAMVGKLLAGREP